MNLPNSRKKAVPKRQFRNGTGESVMKTPSNSTHINPNRACNVAAVGGILRPFGAFTECRRGNLLSLLANESPRHPVAFFFLAFRSCVVPFDGGNAQAVFNGLFPIGQYFHLARRRLPRGKGGGSRKNTYWNRIMSTLSKAQCIRAQRVQTPLNHLRATARAVRRAVNPYASLDRVSSLSSVLRNATEGRCKLLRRAFTLSGEA